MTTWYAVRAFGLVAYALLTASMLWGLWMSTRAPAPPRQGRPWVLDVHRSLGAVALLFTLAHLGALVADSYVQFDLVEVLVPFASAWSPAAVAWGIVAFYGLAAVQLSSLLRKRLSRRTWRQIHLASFGAYLLASLHFLTAGTDAGNPLLLALAGAAFALVAGGTAYRVLEHLEAPAHA